MAKVYDDARADFCDPALERAVLSCCMRSKEALVSVCAKADVKTFLEDSHRELFKVLVSLYTQEVEEFDPITVITEARMSKRLQKIHGGEENYIHNTYERGVHNLKNFNSYFSKVLDISKKYEAYVKTLKIQEAILENKEPIEKNKNAFELVSFAENELITLNFESTLQDEPVDMSDGVDEWLEAKLNDPVRITGTPTGLPILDELIDGLIPGTLTIVAARRKIGKSAMLLNIARNVAYKPPFPSVLVLDTEMPTIEQWRPRLLANLARVSEKKIRRGKLNDVELAKVQMATDILKRGSLYHHHIPGFSVDQVISLFRMFKTKIDIKLGIFDYIKLPSNADMRNQKEYQILGDVTTRLKDLASILDIPILCAVQVNREGRVADSDKIERYGDVLAELTLRNDDELKKVDYNLDYGQYKLVVRASRRGGETPEEGIGIDFKKSIMTIQESKRQMVDFSNLQFEEDEEYVDEESDDNDDEVMF
jgi:replicative DNA helicase